jgi:NAD(P)-dependent dehydrogenase (short-subunit alcohol dehydrogenase family)
MTSPDTATATPRPLVLVTGGSRGLGRNAALALAGRGVDVILTYRSASDEAAAAVAAIEGLGARGAALRLDTAETASFPAFVDQVRALLGRDGRAQRLHALVNNAGAGVHAPFADTTEAQFDAMVAVHLKGPFFLTQALLPLIADGGRVLNVSSGLTRFALPGYAAYAAMKGAIEVLSRYQARELGARGIAVNTLAPGAIETDFGGGAVRDTASLNAFVASQTALGRVGVPDDIGPLVASLLDASHGWISGQRIEASGGMFL